MTRGRVLTLGAVVLAVAATASVLVFPGFADWLRDVARGDGVEQEPPVTALQDSLPDPRALVRADGTPVLDLSSFEDNPDIGVVAADDDGIAYAYGGGTWTALDADGNRWRAGSVAGRFVPSGDGAYDFQPAPDLGADVLDWVDDHLTADPGVTAEGGTIRIRPRPAFEDDPETAARSTIVPGGTLVPEGDDLVVVRDRETRHVWVEDVEGGQLVFDRASVTLYRDGIIEAGDAALPTVTDAVEPVAAIVLDAGAAVVATAPDLTRTQADWLDNVLGTLPNLERGDAGWEVVPVAPVLAQPTRDDMEWRPGEQGPELFIDGELAGVVVRTSDGWFTFLPRPNLSQVARDLAMDVFRRTPGVGPYALALEEERAAREEAARLEAERAAAVIAGEDIQQQEEAQCTKHINTLVFGKRCIEWVWNPVAGGLRTTRDWTTDRLGDTRDLAVDAAGEVADGAQATGQWVEAAGRASIDYTVQGYEKLEDGTVRLTRAGMQGAEKLAGGVKSAYDDTMTWIGTLGEIDCGQAGPGPASDGSGPPRDRPPDYAPSAQRLDEWELARTWMPMLKLSPEEQCGEIIRIVARVLPYGPDGEPVEDLGDAATAEVVYTVFLRQDGGRFGGIVAGLRLDEIPKVGDKLADAMGHPGDNEGMVVALARTVLRSGRCTTGFELVEVRTRSHKKGWGGFGPISEMTAPYEDERSAAEIGKCPRLGPGHSAPSRIDPAPRGDPDAPFSVYVAESKHALWLDANACDDALLGVDALGAEGGAEECDDGRDPYDLGNWVELLEDAGPCVPGADGEAARPPEQGGWPPASDTYLHSGLDKAFYCQTRGTSDDNYHSPLLLKALTAAPPTASDDEDTEEPAAEPTDEPDDPEPDGDPSPPPPSTDDLRITEFTVSREQVHEDTSPSCGPTTSGLTVVAQGQAGVDEVRVDWQVGSDDGTTELSPASDGAWIGRIGPFDPATLSSGSATVDLTAVATDSAGRRATAAGTITLLNCDPGRDFPPQWTSDHASVAVTPSRSDAASGHGGSYTVGETVTLCYSWDWSPEVRVYLLAWQDQPYSSSGEVSGAPAVLDARTEGEPGNSCGSVAVPSPGGYHVFGVEVRDVSTSCEGGSGTRCSSILAEARIWIWVEE